MTFDRPFDRSTSPSIAYSVAHLIAPAIAFDRPFDRYVHKPPYPQSDRSAALGLAACVARSSGRGREGAEGGIGRISRARRLASKDLGRGRQQQDGSPAGQPDSLSAFLRSGDAEARPAGERTSELPTGSHAGSGHVGSVVGSAPPAATQDRLPDQTLGSPTAAVCIFATVPPDTFRARYPLTFPRTLKTHARRRMCARAVLRTLDGADPWIEPRKDRWRVPVPGKSQPARRKSPTSILRGPVLKIGGGFGS